VVDVDEGNNEGVCDDVLDVEKIVTLALVRIYLHRHSHPWIHPSE
jgi:hypothetical protein